MKYIRIIPYSSATSNPGVSHAPSTHVTPISCLSSFITHLRQLFVTCGCGVLHYWVMGRSFLQCAVTIAETHNCSKYWQWPNIHIYNVLLWQSYTQGSRNTVEEELECKNRHLSILVNVPQKLESCLYSYLVWRSN